MIYFIQGKRSRLIKIGRTKRLDERLNALQIGSPEPLVILQTGQGDYAEEHALHRMFAQHRVHGEWFNPAPELIDYIRKHARGRFYPLWFSESLRDGVW